MSAVLSVPLPNNGPVGVAHLPRGFDGAEASDVGEG